MAHNITTVDRQEGTEQAWHGLTVIREDLDLDHNWLQDWDITPRPLFFEDGKEVPFKQLVCTDDNSLLIGAPYNPETYRPMNNGEFIQLVRDSISGAGHEVVSVGSVRSRGRTFVTVKLAELGKYSAGGRKFEPFLNFGNGHDKSSVLWANTSGTCTVCDNTYSMNLLRVESGKAEFGISQRHTIKSNLKFPEIAKLVDQAVGVHREFAEAFESFSETKIARVDAARAYAGFFAAPDVEKLATRGRNVVAKMVDLFSNGRGNKGENLADLFSGATDYYTHEVNANNRQRQFESSEFGSSAQRKRDFFNVCNDAARLNDTVARGVEVLAV